jgi:hypothetical protein
VLVAPVGVLVGVLVDVPGGVVLEGAVGVTEVEGVTGRGLADVVAVLPHRGRCRCPVPGTPATPGPATRTTAATLSETVTAAMPRTDRDRREPPRRSSE